MSAELEKDKTSDKKAEAPEKKAAGDGGQAAREGLAEKDMKHVLGSEKERVNNSVRTSEDFEDKGFDQVRITGERPAVKDVVRAGAQDQSPSPVDKRFTDGAADAIFKATVGYAANEQAIRSLLEGRTTGELKAIDAAFTKKYGTTLEEKLKTELSGENLDFALKKLHQGEVSGKDGTKLEGHVEIIDDKKKSYGSEQIRGTDTPIDASIQDRSITDKLGANLNTSLEMSFKKTFEDIIGQIPTLEHKGKITQADGSVAEFNEKGQVARTTGADGKSREFTYDDKGNLTRIKGLHGHVFERDKDDPNVWKSDDGKTWHGKLSVTADGVMHYQPEVGQPFTQDANGKVKFDAYDPHNRHTDKVEPPVKPEDKDKPTDKPQDKPPEKQVDQKDVEKRVEALHKAADGWGTDEEGIHKALEGTDKAEREAMDKLYKEKYGQTIEEMARDEMSGSDLEKALVLLKAEDPAEVIKKAAMTQEQADRIIKTVDSDNNGYMSKDELDKAIKDGKFQGDDLRAAEEIRKSFDSIKNLSDDEWFRESEVSVSDLKKFVEIQPTEKVEADFRRQMHDWATQNFDKADADKDGFLSDKELAAYAKDPARSAEERQLVENMRAHIDSIQDASNDEWGWENDGITRKDIEAYAKERDASDEAQSIKALDKRVEETRLHEKVAGDSRLSESDKKTFEQNMQDFEKRAKERGMSDQEIAKTYHEITRLLESKGETPVSQAQRAILAQQIMDQAAHPTTIDQGNHNTCNVTTAEVMIYTKNPSAAARLVTDVATTGEYRANDGTLVKLDAESLKPDVQSQHIPNPDGERSFATQLFNVTSVNVYYQKHNPNIHYEQHQVPLADQAKDAGERRMDYSKTPPEEVKDANGNPERSPGLNNDQIVEAHNMIIDRHGGDVMLERGLVGRPGSDTASHISSEEHLNEKLAEMKKDGKLPVIVYVHTATEPIWTDSGGGTAGGAGGAHVVTITDYEPGPPPKVQVDNQWGTYADHGKGREMSPHDLYMAMQDPPESAALLQKDVDWDRAHGTVDTYKEFDLLRLKVVAKMLSADDYPKELEKTIKDANARWEQQKKDGTFDQKEHDRAVAKLETLVSELPADKRLRVLDAAANTESFRADYTEHESQRAMIALLDAKDKDVAEGKFDKAKADEFAANYKVIEELLNKLPEESRKRIQSQVVAHEAEKAAAKVANAVAAGAIGAVGGIAPQPAPQPNPPQPQPTPQPQPAPAPPPPPPQRGRRK